MSYSTMAHALIGYIENHLGNFDIREMSDSFGFSEILHSKKKIIDIAFESGFSSHESYTRAFRKVFGMTPSRFRVDRPLIGRKQLDSGVFGLERLVSKEKRSDELIMKQDNSKTILYDIRKIEHGAYGSNGSSIPSCMEQSGMGFKQY